MHPTLLGILECLTETLCIHNWNNNLISFFNDVESIGKFYWNVLFILIKEFYINL